MSSKEERFWRVGQDSFKYDFASKIFHKLLLNSLKLLLYEHMHMHFAGFLFLHTGNSHYSTSIVPQTPQKAQKHSLHCFSWEIFSEALKILQTLCMFMISVPSLRITTLGQVNKTLI